MIIVCIAIQLYMLVIFVRIIMSWFLPTPGTTYAQIYDVFYRLTEPVLAPIRVDAAADAHGCGGARPVADHRASSVGQIVYRAIC